MHNSTTTTTARPATQGTTIKHSEHSVREDMENGERVMHCGGSDLWLDMESGEMLSFAQARAVHLGDFRERHADGDPTSIAAGEQ